MRGRGSPLARLLIADDNDLVRAGLRAMLAQEPGLVVAGEAANGREAVELCRSLAPDLVLMDVRMPEMDGIEATRVIKEECPETSVLVVTTHDSSEYLMASIRAGAVGYVLKDATAEQLVSAVRRALSGESPLNQELAMRLLRSISDEAAGKTEPPLPIPKEKRQEESLPEPLTSREIEVLRMLTEGKSNREITQDLSVSLSTTKSHVHNIISKLGVSGRTQAALRAIELSLLPRQGEEEE